MYHRDAGTALFAYCASLGSMLSMSRGTATNGDLVMGPERARSELMEVGAVMRKSIATPRDRYPWTIPVRRMIAKHPPRSLRHGRPTGFKVLCRG